MKYTFILFILSFMLFAGCRSEEETNLVPEDYTGWNRTTETELDYPIPGHENHYRKIYINSIGETYSVQERDGHIVHEYPEGTIIIKDIYPGLTFQEGSTPVMQTVMVKNSENPHNRGGWLWIIKDLSTGNETIMDDLFCLGCHSNANEAHPYGDKNSNEELRDYVFFPPERK